MEIFIGADYRGFEAKQKLCEWLAGEPGYTVVDKGAYEIAENDDFNDPAIAVAQAVRENPGTFGILICDSAHGMTMQANRFKGVRAANCSTPASAKLAREHDDANVLCLSAGLMNEAELTDTAREFLTTKFVPLERRVRRVNRLDERNDYA
ncbi:RpiB/LacA/LacB family sugar-phosphate isomerase [Candidatus Saccharibacteria bacterium]|nr:RpiB/LacA/LacB family sugar-phosphate isomerase [Candidatus Saccharibacteria bacterium]